jgi:hypothetical protein
MKNSMGIDRMRLVREASRTRRAAEAARGSGSPPAASASAEATTIWSLGHRMAWAFRKRIHPRDMPVRIDTP